MRLWDKGGAIDAAISSVTAPVADFVSGVNFYSVPFAHIDLPLIVVWLAAAAVFFNSSKPRRASTRSASDNPATASARNTAPWVAITTQGDC